jgi:hypothetical protein
MESGCRGRVAAEVLFVAVLCALLPGVARSDAGGTLPAAQVQGTRPRVMLVADTSAAMDEAVYHADYDATVSWSGVFTGAASYLVNRSGSKTPRSFNYDWPSQPSVFLVESAHGHAGVYSGNYLNWVFHHASAAQRAAVPRFTRIDAIKDLLAAVVALNTDVSFGLAGFDGDDGGEVAASLGSTQANLLNAIAGLEADAGAPWAEAAEDMLDLFSRSGTSAPAADPRQPAFLLLLAGGLPTRDLDVSPYLQDADGDGDGPGTCSSLGAPYPDSLECSSYLDDVAWYMANHDLRPDLPGRQVVYTYVVGFQVDHYLFKQAAANGNGDYEAATPGLDPYAAIERMLADMKRRVAAPTPLPTAAATGDLRLSNRPNPFNPTTVLVFELPRAGFVRLSVHDVAGHLVRTLVEDDLPAGSHEAAWNGRDAAGRNVASGSYLARLESGGRVEVARMGLCR